MRIALRPSGGRGDYELTGSDNGVYASELLEKQFYYQLTPNLEINGKARASRLSGKPRIRPQEDGKHPYTVMYSILLLPSPRREFVKTATSALTKLICKDYVIYGIDVDLVDNKPTRVVFAPSNIWARSQGGTLRVNFIERMAIISMLWAVAKGEKSELAQLIRQHQAAVASSNHPNIQNTATQIQKRFEVNTDVLPLLLNQFDLPSDLSSSSIDPGITNDTTGFESEDSDVSPQVAFRERVKKWRKQAERGSDARKFSITVREAYDYRCFFSGERFPRLSIFDSSGVDSAHILPWSTYGLNSVSNGICLCKQCHWGFDNGLLRLDFNEQSSSYVLSIPKNIEDIAVKEKFDLAPFQKCTGVIDRSRLPKNPGLWPDPKYIQELNSKFFNFN
ncbi:MAG: HNH endonuclease [Thainema sp.]